MFLLRRLEWLARRLALGGGLSRRDAQAAISHGAVTVSATFFISETYCVDPADSSGWYASPAFEIALTVFYAILL